MSDERDDYSDPDMCECGNERTREADGELRPACDRCLAMEEGRYVTILPNDGFLTRRIEQPIYPIDGATKAKNPKWRQEVLGRSFGHREK